MYHCYFLINYIDPPKVFFLSFGPLFKKFAHHCRRELAPTGNSESVYPTQFKLYLTQEPISADIQLLNRPYAF